MNILSLNIEILLPFICDSFDAVLDSGVFPDS